MTEASPTFLDRLRRWLPRGRGWWLVGGAFLAGLLLFLVVWLGRRDEFEFYRAPGGPRAQDGQVFEPLPVPQTDAGRPASGLDDEPAPPPEQSARIEEPPRPAPSLQQPSQQAPGGTPQGPATAAYDTPPRPLHAPAPQYPSAALRAGIEGEVVIRIEVGADGVPGSLEIVRGSRNRDLDRAALRAVRQWRFQPAMRGGTPVPATVQQTITFTLPD